MKLLDGEVPQAEPIVALDIVRSSNPLGRRVGLSTDAPPQLDRRRQPGSLGPTDPRTARQLRPGAGSKPGERTVAPPPDANGHPDRVPSPPASSEENGP